MANQKKNTKVNGKATVKGSKAAATKAPTTPKAKAAPAVKETKATTTKAPKVVKAVKAAPVVQAAAPVAVKARDPRLPVPGTPIIKQYKGQQIVVVEAADGTFVLGVNGHIQVKGAKSLSAVVAEYLKAEGKSSSVNGYFWMGLTGDRPAPRARNPLAHLGALVTKAEARLQAAQARVTDAETALANARKALADAVAAEQTPAAE